MDALRTSAGVNMGSDLDVIMVGPWMLCGNGWSLIWTLSWSALRQWIWSDLDVIMVGTWMLCGNGYGLIWTLSWLAHGCSAKTSAGTTFSAAKSRKHRKYRCIRCLHIRASTTPPPEKRDRWRRFRLQSPRNTVNTDVGGVCAARVNSTSVPLTGLRDL